MRKKIYQMVHLYDYNMLSVFYKWFMIVVIALSLIPLTVKKTNNSFLVIDGICLVIYIADFTLRWICADYKFNNSHWSAFVKYPFRLIQNHKNIQIFKKYQNHNGHTKKFQKTSYGGGFAGYRLHPYFGAYNF